MAKFDVDEIKAEAERTLHHYQGRKGTGVAEIRNKPLSILQIRTYTNKVLFLCKEIEKLNKRLAP